MYDLKPHKRVIKYLTRLPGDKKELVKNRLRLLAEAPGQYPGLVSMTGQWKGYSRIRIGELRVIFEIDELTKTIYVDYLGPRGEIYKS
jgi:mRNA interferase RelE/StbE